MATVLVDYRFGGNSAELKKLIAEVMVNESPLLQTLTFDELTDNNVSRQKMFDVGDIQEHTVGDTWTIVNPTWDYRDAPLTILGDNVTVDNFGDLASGQQNLMAQQIAEKARQISRRYDKLAIYGGVTNNGALAGSAMVGLLKHIARCEGTQSTSLASDLDGWLYTSNDSAAHNKQVVYGVATASVAVSMAMIAALRDAVKPKATAFIMSLLMRRKVEALCQAQGTNLDVREGKAGQIVTMLGEQKVLVNEAIKDNMPDGASNVTNITTYDYASGTGDISPIFAVAIGDSDFTGLNGKGMIQIEDLAGGGVMETLDAKGKRIKAYLGTALRKRTAAAVLLGTNYAG